MTDRDFDAIVIGSGPGGATAAHVLTAAGWSVLIFDRRWRPEPSWIDRAGRCLGIYWLAAGVVIPFLRLFLS